MEEIKFITKGIIIGFSIAAPVGPIGIICINRTLSNGRLSGFISGLGAAVADTVYGIIAGFGLTIISNFLIKQQTILHIVGGTFLIYVGIKNFIKKPNNENKNVRINNSLIKDFISVFFLTMTNPVTILAFVAIFAGLGLVQSDGNYFNAIALICGVFLGSMFWWLILTEVVGVVHKKLRTAWLGWINRLSGIIISIFGIIALISLFI